MYEILRMKLKPEASGRIRRLKLISRNDEHDGDSLINSVVNTLVTSGTAVITVLIIITIAAAFSVDF